MVWTAPKTWSSGEAVTRANLQMYLSDQLTFLAAAPQEQAWTQTRTLSTDWETSHDGEIDNITASTTARHIIMYTVDWEYDNTDGNLQARVSLGGFTYSYTGFTWDVGAGPGSIEHWTITRTFHRHITSGDECKIEVKKSSGSGSSKALHTETWLCICPHEEYWS